LSAKQAISLSQLDKRRKALESDPVPSESQIALSPSAHPQSHDEAEEEKYFQWASEKAKYLSQIQALQNELHAYKVGHEKLEKKYSELKSIYDTALEESSPTSFLEKGDSLLKKRVFVLKSVNLQLQRQAMAYKTSLESKESFVYQVQEDLLKVKDILESVVVKEVHSLLHKASCEFST
jgi:hypothetical protein